MNSHPHRGRSLRLFACVLSLTCLAACRIVDSAAEAGAADPAEFEAQTAEARRLGNGILEAFQRRDFAMLKELLPGPLGSRITEAAFENSCDKFERQFGTLESFSYRFELVTPAVRNLIWIARFVRTGEDGRRIEQDLMFRLVAGFLDGRMEVLSFGFL